MNIIYETTISERGYATILMPTAMVDAMNPSSRPGPSPTVPGKATASTERRRPPSHYGEGQTEQSGSQGGSRRRR